MKAHRSPWRSASHPRPSIRSAFKKKLIFNVYWTVSEDSLQQLKDFHYNYGCRWGASRVSDNHLRPTHARTWSIWNLHHFCVQTPKTSYPPCPRFHLLIISINTTTNTTISTTTNVTTDTTTDTTSSPNFLCFVIAGYCSLFRTVSTSRSKHGVHAPCSTIHLWSTRSFRFSPTWATPASSPSARLPTTHDRY